MQTYMCVNCQAKTNTPHSSTFFICTNPGCRHVYCHKCVVEVAWLFGLIRNFSCPECGHPAIPLREHLRQKEPA